MGVGHKRKLKEIRRLERIIEMHKKLPEKTNEKWLEKKMKELEALKKAVK